MISYELAAIFQQLQTPAKRAAGARALAAYAGARDVLLFCGDAACDSFVPAAGLPPMRCDGSRWHDFLRHCARTGSAAAEVPDPAAGHDLRAFGLADDAAHAIVVFVDAQPGRSQCRAVSALLPLLGASLALEPPALVAALEQSRRDLEQARHALHASERRKDDFLAMLAHELRNPLAPISMAAQLLKHGPANPARLQQTCQIIDRQVNHMTCLLDDLLDVSRVTGGKAQLTRALHDMRSIVDQALEQVRPLINARGHHLTLNLAERDTNVRGDGTRLVQAVANLLDNAARYTAPGGDIWIRLVAHADEVVLTVRDSGVGIDAALLPHVFDLFIQGERRADRPEGGLGLGLALVRSLAHRHGGDVTAHSDGPGHGSRFELVLPRALAQQSEPAPAGVETDGGAALAILIVDDNEDAARMLGFFLQQHGHHIELAFNGERALAMAARHVPQVLLLDIGLPDMDGWELAQRLRALPATRASLMIALSGYGTAADRERSRAAGIDHHLTKPVDALKLAELLGSVPAAPLQ